jgi:Zinc finger C-x8-C-x5-C-x3-H type (and similar)
MSNKTQICSYFLKGHCKFSAQDCRFLHPPSSVLPSSVLPSSVPVPYLVPVDPPHENRRRKKKNTESFAPTTQPPDMRLICVSGREPVIPAHIQSRDLIIVSNLFGEQNDFSIYHRLMSELNSCGIPEDQLWKLWHGDSHLIADDHTKFKDRCPTFVSILDRIRTYFQMDIKATRLNVYRDQEDWKPFHHDAAAVKPDKARIQNFTVGVSFGATRDAAFEDALSANVQDRRILSLPLANGMTYCFTKDINIRWRHGILQHTTNPYFQLEHSPEGRISIIAWGWTFQDDCLA